MIRTTRPIRLLRFAAVAAVLALVAVVSAGHARAGATARFRVLLYVAADNDLEAAAVASLGEIEAFAGTGAARVAMEIDRSAKHSRAGGDWSGSRRYRMTRGFFGGHRLEEVERRGASDSGSAATLRAFVEWGLQAVEGDKTILVLWGHGRGDRGLLVDESARSHMMPRDVAGALRGLDIDVLAMDLCSMQTLGVAAELASSARYMVGSATARHALGWPYARLLAHIDAAPGLTPRDVATWLAEHAGDRGGEFTGSAIDLGVAPRLAGDVGAVLEAARALPVSERARLRDALEALPAVTPAAKTVDLGAALAVFGRELSGARRASRSLAESVVVASASPAFAGTSGLAVPRATLIDALSLTGSAGTSSKITSRVAEPGGGRPAAAATRE